MAWSGAVGQSNGGRLEGFQSALSVLMRRRFSTGMDPGPKRRLALFHMRQRSCDSTWSSVYPEETLSAIYEKRKSATLPLRPAKRGIVGAETTPIRRPEHSDGNHARQVRTLLGRGVLPVPQSKKVRCRTKGHFLCFSCSDRFHLLLLRGRRRTADTFLVHSPLTTERCNAVSLLKNGSL